MGQHFRPIQTAIFRHSNEGSYRGSFDSPLESYGYKRFVLVVHVSAHRVSITCQLVSLSANFSKFRFDPSLSRVQFKSQQRIEAK